MTIQIGMLLFPRLTQLDLTGPFEVLAKLTDARLHLVWERIEPVVSDSGMTFLPTTTLADCPALDVLFVPGGWGQADLMQGGPTLDFLRAQGKTARWVTSVCTGSLLLGAAGLLAGYRAATHWAFMELLPGFGAIPVSERIVVDRNRITAGGVTAGIDFGLRLVAEIEGEAFARSVELGLEYDPQPPFRCGHPRLADATTVETVRARFAESVKTRGEALAAAR